MEKKVSAIWASRFSCELDVIIKRLLRISDILGTPRTGGWWLLTADWLVGIPDFVSTLSEPDLGWLKATSAAALSEGNISEETISVSSLLHRSVPI
ncbi:hypothetical protein AC578_6977 [Pseudocercospora eumusae]|uniref:Uncharacterized protein n=1 Tax=Pseudocercospora eumusae TaxID=321146 RepID=A0A139H9F2_9PEZI|nr:hypothetical protein AC578_6977 [Pseudocercospora eumusae]